MNKFFQINMKVKSIINNQGLAIITAFLMMLYVNVYSQVCTGNQLTLTIQNVTNPTPTTVEYDVFIENTGSTVIKLSAFGGNVRYPSGGFAATAVLTVVDQPSASAFPGLQSIAPNHNNLSQQLRWTQNPIGSAAASVVVPSNTPMKFARFRLTNPTAWAESTAGVLYFSNGGTGISLNTLAVYCNGNTDSWPISLANSNLVLAHTSTVNPVNFTINPSSSCPTAASASNLLAESCIGAANGSASITITGAANNSSSVTYTVDGGSSQNATLSAGAFSVLNLSAGSHVVAVTYPSCSAVSTSSFNIGAGEANVTPSVSVSASASTICAGTSVTFTATPTNGGAAPTYQWKLNGNDVGTGSTTYTNTGLVNTDVVTVVMTANNTCQTSSTANGNSVTMTVTPNVTPTFTAVSAICSGGSLSALPTSSTNTTPITGTWSPALNNTATTTYTFTPTAGQCATTTTLSITVTPNVTPTVSIAASTSTICSGTSVTFTATPTNGGSIPTYQWQLGGVDIIGETSATYTSAGLANNDVVTVVMTANNTCQTSAIANGNSVTMTVTPSSTNTTPISACGSYVWNGTTYTSSGVYTGSTTNCVTESLDLTITPATTIGSVSTSICAGASYTWPANGQTYTSAQSGLTVITGCNTATLDLTITLATTTGSVDTSICDGSSYTWPANGQTYTTAQSGLTVITGCNTATLNLTITAVTTIGSVDTSICALASYTWPANGQTYTSAQTGLTVVTGCNTATLNLTLTPVQDNTLNVDTIANSYTWIVNGQTYTTSGTYNFVDSINCVNEILILSLTNDIAEESSDAFTIFPNPTNGNVVISLLSDDQCRLNVYDYHGQLVFENPSISNGYGVNLSDYSPGVYIFRVYTSNQIYTRRIIKN